MTKGTMPRVLALLATNVYLIRTYAPTMRTKNMIASEIGVWNLLSKIFLQKKLKIQHLHAEYPCIVEFLTWLETSECFYSWMLLSPERLDDSISA